MAQLLGSLLVSLGLETGAFKSGLDASEKQLRATTKRIENVGKSMQSFGAKMSLAVTLPMIALGKASVTAAMESQAALAQVNQTIKSMGNAAGRTTQQLQALASGQMRKSLYDDDEILRKVTTTLLTFGKVTGDTFDQAQQAAIDLSAKFGGDLQASAIMLGKALNDPVKGITALTRAGVSFTAEQKESIKTMTAAGNLAGAQKLILAELTKEFGGAAEAAAKADPFAQMKHSLDDFKEAVGASLLKILPPLTDALNKIMAAFNGLSPGTQDMVVKFGLFLAVMGPIVGILGTLVTITAPLIAAFTTIAGSGGIILATTSAFAGLMAVLSPILIPLAAIAAAVGAVYLAWKYWDKITQIVGAVGSALVSLKNSALASMQSMVNGIHDWLVGKLNAAFKFVTDKIAVVKNAFFGLYDAVVGHSYVPDMVDGIEANFLRLEGAMVAPAKTAAERTKQVFERLQGDVQGIMSRLFPDQAASAAIGQDRSQLKSGIAAGGAGGFSVGQLQEGLRALQSEEFKNAFKDFQVAVNDNAATTETANVRIKESFKDMADKTLSAMQNLASSLKGGGFLDILGAVIGLGMQLGSIGAFGKGISTKINSLPGRAMGGSVMGGKAYMVGENGPEIMVPGRGGAIIPNHALGGSAITVHVEASPYFDVRVNGHITQAAPAIANAGANIGMARSAYRQGRRVA